ncbi:hypothetical protein Leryth_024300, partial [Lithospermum erythrorhizon]
MSYDLRCLSRVCLVLFTLTPLDYSNTSPLCSFSLLLSTNHRPPIDILSTSTNPPLNPIDPCPHDVPITPVLPTQSPIITSLPTNTSPAPIIASQPPSHYMVT